MKDYLHTPVLFCGLSIIATFTFSSCNKIDIVEVDPKILFVDGETNLYDVELIDDSTIFTCGGKRWEEGFIFRSTDNGSSWTKTQIDDEKCVYTLGFVNDQLGFAGSDFIRMYETQNGGDTWVLRWIPELAFHEVHRPSIRNIQIIDENDFAFVAGENYAVGNIYRSFDAGSTWRFDTLRHEMRAMHFMDEHIGFIGGYGYLAKTIDGGVNWNQMDFQGQYFIAVQMLNASEIIAAGNSGSIYKSTDQGNSWDKVFDQNSFLGEHFLLQNMLFVDESIGFVIGANGVILQSRNGGEDWDRLDAGVDDHLFSITSHQNKIYIGTHNGRILVLDY